ncbi:MAG: hypothetical protein Fur0032_25090 [Terrimicrobiaceae bacterium]
MNQESGIDQLAEIAARGVGRPSAPEEQVPPILPDLAFPPLEFGSAAAFDVRPEGTHEGFFSPFEFDITNSAREGENELLVRVDNDAICMGNNSWDDSRAGDKIYAATGLGWDEPGLGWHHCPPGMGIHRPVRIESRPTTFIRDLFVRPLPENGCAEAWVEVSPQWPTHPPARS